MSFVYCTTGRSLAVALGLLLPIAYASAARAQSTGGGAAAGGGGGGNPANPGGPLSGTAAPAGGGGTPGGPGTPGGTSSTSTSTSSTTTSFFPGGVAPVPPGGTLGGGNAQFSSSKPITGNERDTFDFRPGAGGGGTARGNENSSFVLGGGGVNGAASNPGVHQVRKGDTLWDICDHYFRNPYQWPRIWAYNPQIQNPHWIFPGDQVRLRGGGEQVATTPQGTATGGGLVDRRRQVPPETIFLRTQGYIDDDTNNWGEISGSPEEKMILTDNDEIYLRIASNHDLKVGQELTIYRPVRSVGSGKLIEIQGTAKVDQWNPKERVARAKITEALDAIERGARVGPVTRRFEVVPPVRNDKDVTAKILTSVQPHQLFGQNQIVFIDQGDEAGLKPGNRLFVIRKGDAWHGTQTTGSSAKRIALEDDSPAATENVPKPRNPAALPEEVQAELRVINVRKNTAMAIVTNSRHEIEAGDRAFARKGY
jgi:hypothetical protein